MQLDTLFRGLGAVHKLRYYGTTALRYNCTTVLRYYGTTVVRHYCSTVLRYYSTSYAWYGTTDAVSEDDATRCPSGAKCVPANQQPTHHPTQEPTHQPTNPPINLFSFSLRFFIIMHQKIHIIITDSLLLVLVDADQKRLALVGS